MVAHIPMEASKRLALVAHDNCKEDLLAWAQANRSALQGHELYATGGTGSLLERELGLSIQRLLSGPLGGDQQLGARIAEGGIDVLVFFWDPLEPQPHDPDVKALLRLAVLYNIPTASNWSSAEFLLTSPHFSQVYQRRLANLGARIGR
jgi:methylglyoxal synthase